MTFGRVSKAMLAGGLVILLCGAGYAGTREDRKKISSDERRGESVRRKTSDEVDAALAGTWCAYFELKSGKKILVDDYMPDISGDYTKKEDYWYHVKYSDYKGPKQRLAIIKFENKVPQQFRALVPLADMEAQLVSEFFKTNRYTLIERVEVGSVLKEQDFGATKRVAKPSAAKIGQILGAQFIVHAAVTEFVPDAAKFGAAAGKYKNGVLGGLGIYRKRAEVAINIRIIDATTSEVVASIQKRGWAAIWGAGGAGGAPSGGGVVGGIAGGYKKTPLGKAAQSCMAKTVFDIAKALKDKVWQGRVMLAKGDKIYVNAGENMGMRSGMVLSVLDKGEELVDPETGIVLGAETNAIGTIVVNSVKEKYSIAVIQEGCKGAKKGDFIEFVR